MSYWPGLGLAPSEHDIDWLATRQPPAQPRATSVPSGVDYETDIQNEHVPIAVEHTPNDVLRFRQEARRWNPSRLYALYEELPRMGAGPQLDKARKAIMAARLEFLPMPEAARDEDNKSPEAETARWVAAYFASQFGKPKRRTELLRGIERRRNFGVAALALRVQPGAAPGGLEKVEVLEEIHPRRFRLDPSNAEWRFYPKRFNQGEHVAVAPLMETGSLILLEDGARTTPLDQRGVYSQIVVAACIYIRGLRWWARLCEQHGTPPRLATYAKNLENGPALAEKLARNFGANNYGVKPEGIEMQFLSALASVHPDMHERIEEFCLRTFDAAVLAHSQGMSVRAEGGGRAWSETAERAFAAAIAHDLEIAAADYQEQLVEPMARRNFEPAIAEKHTPVLTFIIPAPVDRLVEAQIAETAVRAGARLSQDEFRKRIGYRSPKPGEEVMARLPEAGPGISPEPKPKKLSEDWGQADGAPEGIGEEIVAPYRDIFRKALAEGLTTAKAMQRVVAFARRQPDTPAELIDRLASVLFDGVLTGVQDVRREREAK